MIRALLSHDLPRSRILGGLLLACFVGLLGAPFIFPGTQALNVAAKILVFILLVANYAGFIAPKAALFSNIGLMVAILLWRPQGLYPVGAK